MSERERAMEVRQVRFGRYQWRTIQIAADREGISASAFIRDAAWARALIYLMLRDSDYMQMNEVYEAIIRAGHPELADALKRLSGHYDRTSGLDADEA